MIAMQQSTEDQPFQDQILHAGPGSGLCSQNTRIYWFPVHLKEVEDLGPLPLLAPLLWYGARSTLTGTRVTVMFPLFFPGYVMEDLIKKPLSSGAFCSGNGYVRH